MLYKLVVFTVHYSNSPHCYNYGEIIVLLLMFIFFCYFQIKYDFLVVAMGLQLNYDAVSI